MSIMSAIFSSRRSSSRFNARIVFLMDNLFAIAFGLGLRFVVDNVSNHDFKLTGTLVGLWEGVVTLHFLKKMPNSLDPYIAYAVRLFVDFLVTESIIRLVLVIVWTGLGMVLADIAPAIWHDVGAHRVWRRFRRDMYYMSRSVPTVNIPELFPRARVVRFSPVIQPTEISETLSTLSPTPATPTVTSPPPTTRVVAPTPPTGPLRTRRVPGGDVSVFSETNSDRGSVLGSQPPPIVGTSHVRYTVRPRRDSFDESASQAPSNSVDDSNISSNASSVSTETPAQPLRVDFVEEEEIEIPVRRRDKGKGRAIDNDEPGTPTQPPFALPPTPSDSNRPHFEVSRNSIVPTITGMPSIPDFYESGLGSDWENIRREEAVIPPTPPEKDFDSQNYDSPPIHYIPPPASSVYEPTPRPSTFDQDLWDDVSNAAPPTPYTKPTSEQRTSRLPQPATSKLQGLESRIPQPVKKRKVEPPPAAPQTPLYGDAWDTERDQVPPPTPSVLARTPMYDHTVDLNDSVHPGSEVPVPPAEQDQGSTEPTGIPSEQQGFGDAIFSTDVPWNNLTPPVQDEQQQQQSKVPPTPQTRLTAPPTSHIPTPISPMPEQRPGTVPPTPQNHSGTISPAPHHPLQPVPPIPGRMSQTVDPTPGQRAQTVPSTPAKKPQTMPSTPAQKSRTVPSTPKQQPQPVPPTPGPQTNTVSSTPQQPPQPVPPIPEQQTVPVAPQQPQTQAARPTSGRGSRTVPPTPQQKAQSTLPTPKYKSMTVPPSSPPPQLQPIPPEPIPPTPQQQARNVPIPPTPQQQAKDVPIPPTPQQQARNVPIPPTPQQQARNVPIPPTPSQAPNKSVPPTPQLPVKNVPPTPRNKTKSISPTPQVQQQTTNILPTSQTAPGDSLFDDFLGEIDAKLDGGGPSLELQDLATSQQQQQQQSSQPAEGDLLNLGAGEGVEKTQQGAEGSGDDKNDDNNVGGGVGAGDAEGVAKGGDGDDVQIDENNNPPSLTSSVFSSTAGVPSEIKERNKQAIIIRAQIHELTTRIEELKEEKIKAQGREELDTFSEESTLKEQEIQKAERTLDKLKKRAEKRYQAAMESTGRLTVGKNMAINFETASSHEAAAKLEDLIGLLFRPGKKTIKMEITVPKAGAGVAVKTAVQRVLSEYGIKAIPKVTTVSVNVLPKGYIDMITAFRQNHSRG
ncbi:hypothetical protein D9756_007690 [Leucocoprinus leucothites]|uniref:Uncharacterized protein n=1 Tax=Leucocoprinus leucothites TaxID=201217 RepID=A0A8H5D1V8_9AGAR|nr:hypothetical protein D9756_007690 [Leucoagaricus leucothites]